MPVLNQDFQPQKHFVKKDMVILANQTINSPAIGLTIPQHQLLDGLVRELILHGWHQSLSTLPTTRRTLFWILVAHFQLDQEHQSKGSKCIRCIAELRQSFVVATSPLCLPTLRQRPVGKVVLFTFQRNLHVRAELMYLKQVMCLSDFLFRR